MIYAITEREEVKIQKTVLEGVTIDDGSLAEEPQINNGLDTCAIVLIIVGAVAVLAGGGFAVYWFVIRKRKYIA